MSALEVSHEVSAPPVAPQRPDRALQGLYERHADRIFGFCRNRLRSHQEAEDAVQTTFLHALRALQRGVVPLSETAWLFKIAENVCLTAHRTNGRRGNQEVFEGEELVERAPARDGRNDALFGLESALAAIPERQRQVFVLRELRGLSYREIALQQGVTVAAVETLVFRARRSLARALENGAGLRGRIASVLDLGAVAGAIKTAFGGAAAGKVLVTAAVVAVAAVPAGDTAAPAQAKPQTERQVVGSGPASSRNHQGAVAGTAGSRLEAKRGTSQERASRRRAHAVTARRTAKAPARKTSTTNAAPVFGTPSSTPDQDGSSPAVPDPPGAPEPGRPVAPPVPAIPPENVVPVPLEVPAPPVNLPQVPKPEPLPVKPPPLPADLPKLPAVP